jgi:hypothetical protein
VGGVHAIMTKRVTPLSDQTWYSAISSDAPPCPLPHSGVRDYVWWLDCRRRPFFSFFSLSFQVKCMIVSFFFFFFSFSPHSFIFLFDFYSFYKSLNFFNLVLQLQFLIYFVFHLSPFFFFPWSFRYIFFGIEFHPPINFFVVLFFF